MTLSTQRLDYLHKPVVTELLREANGRTMWSEQKHTRLPLSEEGIGRGVRDVPGECGESRADKCCAVICDMSQSRTQRVSECSFSPSNKESNSSVFTWRRRNLLQNTVTYPIHVQKSDQKKLTHKCFIKKMSTEWPFSTNTNITIYNEWQHGNVTLRGHTQNDNQADFVPILPLPDHEDYPLSYKIILYDYPVVCRVLRVKLSR